MTKRAAGRPKKTKPREVWMKKPEEPKPFGEVIARLVRVKPPNKQD